MTDDMYVPTIKSVIQQIADAVERNSDKHFDKTFINDIIWDIEYKHDVMVSPDFVNSIVIYYKRMIENMDYINEFCECSVPREIFCTCKRVIDFFK